jgi:outer membrane receptor protein involved in Fe transport
VSPQSGWIDQLEIHAARQIITDDRLSQEWQSPDIVTENNRSTLDGVTMQVNSSLASESRLVWGAEYYTDAVDSSRFVQVGESATTDEVRSRFPDRSSMDSAAVYLSGEWNGHDKLTLSTGLRYSWFDINLPADNNHDGLKLTPSDLTGDVHAVYSIKPTLKLVANIGRGFRPPNIFDLATLGPRPGNRFNIANPDLGSETVWSYDVGFKTETDNIEWEVFAFYLDYSDKITSVFTGQTTEDGRDIIRSENRNNVQIYGFESGLYWGLSDDLDVFLVLNHTRGQESNDTEPDIPADRIPPLNGKIGLSYQINDRWSIEPFVLFARDQHRLSPRDVRDPRINPLGTPGWGTINLLLDWHVSAMTQVGFRLENITDRDFREHASGIDAPGRNIGLWLSVNFK